MLSRERLSIGEVLKLRGTHRTVTYGSRVFKGYKRSQVRVCYDIGVFNYPLGPLRSSPGNSFICEAAPVTSFVFPCVPQSCVRLLEESARRHVVIVVALISSPKGEGGPVGSLA